MGVPPNHPFIDGFSLTKTIYFGVPQSMETPIYPITPSKSDRFDPLQLENLEFYDTQAACWTSSSTFEGLHPSDGRMPIFFQNRFEYDSHKAIAIKKSPSILQAPWKNCDTRIYIYIYYILYIYYIYIYARNCPLQTWHVWRGVSSGPRVPEVFVVESLSLSDCG